MIMLKDEERVGEGIHFYEQLNMVPEGSLAKK